MLPEIFDRVEELAGKNADVDTVTNAVYAIITGNSLWNLEAAYGRKLKVTDHLGNPTAIANALYMAKQYMDIRGKKIADRGSAKLVLELKNGVITVRHGESNQVLTDFSAVEGDWKAITNAINKIVEKRGEKWLI